MSQAPRIEEKKCIVLNIYIIIIPCYAYRIVKKNFFQAFLNKNKNGGMHHICIEVDDIKAAMSELTSQKIRCLSKEPRIGAHGKPVVFLHPKDCAGVLVELEEV